MTFDDLADLPRFLIWRNELRGGKSTKVPYCARMLGPLQRAKTDAPLTWAPRADAIAAASRVIDDGGGIGVVLGDVPEIDAALGGIDLDSCRGSDGVIEGWAADLIRRFDTYSEISPSKTGVKLFFRYDVAGKPALQAAMKTAHGRTWTRGTGPHPSAIELHLSNRYFTITEDRLTDVPADWLLIPVDLLLELVQEIGPTFAGKPHAKATGTGTDTSRSAAAFRKGGELRRAGATYDQMVTALLADAETADWAKEKGQAHGGREFKRIWTKADPDNADADLNEDTAALAFAEKHRDTLRFCHTAGRWYIWTGTHWRREESQLAFSWARDICRALGSLPGANARDAAAMAKAATASAVERYARADRRHAVTAEIWDQNDQVLGTPGGVVDLVTGELRPALPGDFITKMTSIAPADTPKCPLWDQFLFDATGGDGELIRFLRQWCGYCLTGSTKEHALLFVFGSGGNGKSVFLNTISGILGDYSAVASMETFTAAPAGRHDADLARLGGARLVTVAETEEGRSWAEARLKALTAGDAVTAHFMRQDYFTFVPKFKLVVVGNHRPQLRAVDAAIARRFNLVPFENKPAVPDRDLEAKLRAEWPAILRWMIEGALDWHQHGLVRPLIVQEATSSYLHDEDITQQWLEQCCTVDKSAEDTSASLFASWTNFARLAGEDPGTQKKLSSALLRRGFRPVRDPAGFRNRQGFKGLKATVYEPV